MSFLDFLPGGGDDDSDMPPPEDYMPLVRMMMDLNQTDTVSPFGSYTYTPKGPDAQTWDEWSAENQPSGSEGRWIRTFNDPGAPLGEGNGDQWIEGTMTGGTRSDYNDYVTDFDQGRGSTRTFEFSPEGQSMFNKVFDPNSYDNYKNEYMDNYNQLIAPNRIDQQDQFQQGMFNRGLPDTSDVYGDVYRNTVGDPNSRQDLLAASNAQGMATNARNSDFDKLMSSMTGTNFNTTPVDVMGPANMAMNNNMMNQQNNQNNRDNIWNTGTQLGAAYVSTL